MIRSVLTRLCDLKPLDEFIPTQNAIGFPRSVACGNVLDRLRSEQQSCSNAAAQSKPWPQAKTL